MRRSPVQLADNVPRKIDAGRHGNTKDPAGGAMTRSPADPRGRRSIPGVDLPVVGADVRTFRSFS